MTTIIGSLRKLKGTTNTLKKSDRYWHFSFTAETQGGTSAGEIFDRSRSSLSLSVIVFVNLRFLFPAIRLERVFRGIQTDREAGDVLSECGDGRSVIRIEDHRSAYHPVLPSQLASGMDWLPLLRIAERDGVRARVRSQQSGHISGIYNRDLMLKRDKLRAGAELLCFGGTSETQVLFHALILFAKFFLALLLLAKAVMTSDFKLRQSCRHKSLIIWMFVWMTKDGLRTNHNAS